MSKKVAIVCASGLGDALLMQIAARQLQDVGFQTVTFSDHLHELSNWFPGFEFAKQSSQEKAFADFDSILLQHDNTEKAKKIHSLPKSIFTFYASHVLEKHGPLRKTDFVFDQNFCIAENIALGTQTLFPECDGELFNGLTPPSYLRLHHHPNRVVIHPTSTSKQKNWLKSSFHALANTLEKEGWEPVFIAAPQESKEWSSPSFPTLSELASYIYESAFLIGNDSGPGHLASNLNLPTLIIGPSAKQLQFWRPGWHRGEIVHPPHLINYTKWTRNHWMHFISVNHVYKQFKKLTDNK